MARKQERNEEIREASKQNIKEAALNQFSQKGLFATRIKDIAEDAGISQGLLYRYYASKDQIFTELIEEALDKMNEAVYTVHGMKVGAKEKVLMSLEELLSTIKTSERYRQTSRLITQAMNSTAIPENAQRSLDIKRDVPYRIFAEIMKEGQNEGTIVDGDPYTLAVLFWSTINGLAIFHATRVDGQPLPGKEYIAPMFIKDWR